MNDDVHHAPGQWMESTQQGQGHIAVPERLITQLLQVIERRADLVSAVHHLSEKQRAALRVFDSVAAGMGVREAVPQRTPVQRDGDELQFEVPDAARSARVFSPAGVTSLDHEHIRNERGYMPIPWELRGQRIARVEFYDAKHHLIGIAGGEAPPDECP